MRLNLSLNNSSFSSSSAVIIDPQAVVRPTTAAEEQPENPQAMMQRSLKLNMTHLDLWERQHGKIPHGAFVILRTGWAKYYNFRDKFFGSQGFLIIAIT